MDGKSLIAVILGIGATVGVALYAIPKLIPPASGQPGGSGSGNTGNGTNGGDGGFDQSPPPVEQNLVANLSINPTQAVVGTPISCSVAIFGGEAPYNIQWAFGDGGSGSGDSETHTYNFQGTFKITCDVRDAFNRKIVSSAFVAIGSNSLPPPPPPPPPVYTDVILGFSINPTSGESPLSVVGNVSLGNSRSAVKWNWGDNTETLNQTAPSHLYYTGTYSGFCQVTHPDGRIEKKSFTIVVSPKPNGSIITNYQPPKSTGAAGYTDLQSSVSLGVTLLEAQIIWNWGDGFTESGKQTSHHVYNSPGTYTMKVTVTAKGITESRSTVIVIGGSGTSPTGAIVVQNKAENIYTFYANFQGSGLSFVWDFGDGATGNGKNPSHTYTRVGTFLVTCVATDSLGQKGTDTVSVFVVQDDLNAKEGDVLVTIARPVPIKGVPPSSYYAPSVSYKNMRNDITITGKAYMHFATMVSGAPSKDIQLLTQDIVLSPNQTKTYPFATKFIVSGNTYVIDVDFQIGAELIGTDSVVISA